MESKPGTSSSGQQASTSTSIYNTGNAIFITGSHVEGPMKTQIMANPDESQKSEHDIVRMKCGVPEVLEKNIGRDDVVSELKQRVLKDKCVTIVGMPGIGKTLTALHCANEWVPGTFHTAILINMDRDKTVKQSLISFLNHVRITPNSSILENVKTVYSFFQNNTCLVILDNIKKTRQRLNFIWTEARGRNVYILGTSRFCELENSFQLEKLSVEHAVQLLSEELKDCRSKNIQDTFEVVTNFVESLKKIFGSVNSAIPLFFNNIEEYDLTQLFLIESFLPLSNDKVLKETVLEYKEKYFDVVLTVVIENKLVNIFELLLDSKIDLNTHLDKECTLLTWALKCNNMKASKRLIDLGADINQRDSLGRIPLFSAIKCTKCENENYDNLNKEVIEYLVTNTEYEILRKQYVLHLAIDCCNINIFKCITKVLQKRNLLDSFSRQKNVRGLNPIHEAVGKGSLDIIKLVVTSEYFDLLTNDGDNVLHVAATGQNPTVVSWLAESFEINGNLLKKYLEQENFEGRTPLLQAVFHRDSNLEVVKVLIDLNANRYVVDIYGRTIFYYALIRKKIDIFKYLVEIETSQEPNNTFIKHFFNQKDIEKNTLLESALMLDDKTGLEFIKLLIEDYNVDHKVVDNKGNTVLHLAVQRGNINTVKYLIGLEMSEQDSLKLNQRNDHGKTLLNLAATYCNDDTALQLVKLLIEDYNIDRKVVDYNGNTVLHLAVQRGRIKTIKYLIGLEIADQTSNDKNSLKLFLNQRNNQGQTLLHLAANNFFNGLELVKLLIEDYNVDRKIVDHEGNTVLHSAIENCNINTYKYLIELEMSEQASIVDKKSLKLFSDQRNKLGRTPLHLAAQRDDGLELVKLLIEDYNVDRKVVDGTGNTVLHLAVQEGNANTIKYLIELEIFEQVPNVDEASLKLFLDQRNNRGQTILHLAVTRGECVGLELIKLLIEDCHMDRKIVDYEGNTVLHLAVQNGLIKTIKYFTGLEMSELASNVDKNSLKLFFNHRNNRGRTILHLAAMNYDDDMTELIKLLIEDCNVDRKVVDYEGNTALHLAAQDGRINTIEYFIRLEMFELASNVDENSFKLFLNQRNNLGKTLLHLAAKRDFDTLEFVKLLIEDCNVDRKVVDYEGNTVLHSAVQRRDLNTVMYLIGLEISEQSSNADENSSKLFLDRKNNQGQTLLHLAAKRDFEAFEFVKLLIEEYNLDRNVVDYHGNTILHYAVSCSNSKPEFIEYLIMLEIADQEPGTNNSSSKTFLNQENYDGNTPLHIAAFINRLSVIRILIENGANDEKKNNNNQTALDIARVKNYPCIVHYLENLSI